MTPNPTSTRRDFLRTAAAAAGTSLLPWERILGAVEGTRVRPNLLFVMSDQQRRYSAGFMNLDPVVTPHLDAMAADGLVLRQALSTSPLCTPFRGSLITGRHPASTGVTTNEIHLEAGENGIGKSLQSAGYHTGWIGKWHLHNPAQEQYGRQFVSPEHRHGFEFWHACNANHDIFWRQYYEDSPKAVLNERGWQIPHEADVAIEFLKTRRDRTRPFALFVSCVPPHNGEVMGRSKMPLREPGPGERPMNSDFHRNLVYHAPEEWEARYRAMKEIPRLPNVEGDYARHHTIGHFAGVDSMDHEFGRIVQALRDEGLYDDTIIVYTSDHGEMMGSHDLMSKNAPHEESIGIPWVMRWGNRLPRGTCDALLSQVDMAPTLLGLMGVGVPSSMDGIDLSSAVRQASSGPQEDVLLYYFSKPYEIPKYGKFGTGWRGLRSHDAVLVEARDYHKGLFGDVFFYDLKKDPWQTKPVHFGDDAATDCRMRDMQALLHKKLRETPDEWLKS